MSCGGGGDGCSDCRRRVDVLKHACCGSLDDEGWAFRDRGSDEDAGRWGVA